jgi:methylated-DNA-[protein]-cysteine S-methyltransferase
MVMAAPARMNGSEKRESVACVCAISSKSLPTGSTAMNVQNFFLEHLETPTGSMRVVTDEGGHLRALDWEDHASRMRELIHRYYGAETQLHDAPRRSKAARALADYFAGDLDAIADLPTAANGTAFQLSVWAALRQIPVGQTVSYGELAARIGRPKAVRAVGLANGANPIAVVVPCHRVIGADASLTGYGGGLDRKRWLLAHECAGQPLFGKSRREAGQ